MSPTHPALLLERTAVAWLLGCYASFDYSAYADVLYHCRQGNTGILDTASHSTLENEFGTHKDDDVVTQILEKGSVLESEVSICYSLLVSFQWLIVVADPRP